MNETRQRGAAEQAARRMIARGERPDYRVRTAQDGRSKVLRCPWLSMDADDRRGAAGVAKTTVTKWLGVHPGALDVES